jgi:hypothetical protein
VQEDKSLTAPWADGHDESGSRHRFRITITDLGPWGQDLPFLLWSAITSSGRVSVPLPRRENAPQFVNFLKERMEADQFRAVVDRQYPLDAIADAYRYVQTGQKVAWAWSTSRLVGVRKRSLAGVENPWKSQKQLESCLSSHVSGIPSHGRGHRFNSCRVTIVQASKVAVSHGTDAGCVCYHRVGWEGVTVIRVSRPARLHAMQIACG